MDIYITFVTFASAFTKNPYITHSQNTHMHAYIQDVQLCVCGEIRGLEKRLLLTLWPDKETKAKR